MLTVDLHLKNETVESALSNLDTHLKLARKDKDRILCVIVGYGSKGGTHKIRTAVTIRLNELVEKNSIKGFINGNELDIFSVVYQRSSFKDRISESEKKEKNPGKIYIGL